MSSSHLKVCLYIDPVLNMWYAGYRETNWTITLVWSLFFPSFTDPCTYNDYAHVQYRAFEGTNCQKFCKCTPLATAADGTITYYWQRFFCAPGTLWDQHKLACVHAAGYTCSKYLQTITTNNIGLTCTERSPYIKQTSCLYNYCFKIVKVS